MGTPHAASLQRPERLTETIAFKVTPSELALINKAKGYLEADGIDSTISAMSRAGTVRFAQAVVEEKEGVR